MKKRIFGILLGCVMLTGLVPAAALACPYCSYTREEGYHYAWDGKTETTHNVMCPHCGYKWTEDHLVHETQITTAATCTEDGSECDLCYCGTIISTRIIPSQGHSYVQHESQTPTCTEIGWDAYKTCSRCDYTTYKQIDALGHDLELQEANPPTCTEEGTIEYYRCDSCGKLFADADGKVEISAEQTVAEASGHDYEWKIDKEATATEKGSKHQECKNCGDRKDAVEISATGFATSLPTTGDIGSLALWAAMLFAGSGGGILIIAYGRKKTQCKVKFDD